MKNNYRVWSVVRGLTASSLAEAEAVEAYTAFDARRRFAAKHRIVYQDCMARRDDARLSDAEWRENIEQERAHRGDY